jgi:hypothetical protein
MQQAQFDGKRRWYATVDLGRNRHRYTMWDATAEQARARIARRFPGKRVEIKPAPSALDER